jgi:twinkle protein
VRIVLATDNDAPGDALAEELSRRLGRERCWRVRWPTSRVDHEYAAMGADPPLPFPPPAAAAGEQAQQAEGEQAGQGADVDGPGGRWYRKDANEVLMRDGPDMLRAFIDTAEPLPITGLLR